MTDPVPNPDADAGAEPEHAPGPTNGAPPYLRRLHPLTPVLGSWTVITAIVLAGFLGNGVQRLEWVWKALRGDVEVETTALLVVGAVILVMAALVVAGSYLSWRYTGFAFTADSDGRDTLLVHRGVVFRSRTRTRLDRVQAVDLSQPLLPRLLGLADLRLEMAAGSGASAKLAYLKLADAEQLRRELEHRVARAAGHDAQVPHAEAGAHGAHPGGTPGPDEGPVVARGSHRLMLLAMLLELVPFLAVLIVVGVPAITVLAVTGLLGAAIDGGLNTLYVLGGTAIALLLVIVGMVQNSIGRLLRDGDFTLRRTPRGVRVTAGLTSRRTQSIEINRVHAVRIHEPLLWRWRGWARVTVRVAGGSSDPQGGDSGPRTLLPVGTRADSLALVADLFGDHLDAVLSDHGSGVPASARVIDPLVGPHLRMGLGRFGAVAREGWLTRKTMYLPYGRAQSLTASQGAIQRWRGLATVYADGAAGTGRWRAVHRGIGEVRGLMADLNDRNRQALHPVSAGRSPMPAAREDHTPGPGLAPDAGV